MPHFLAGVAVGFALYILQAPAPVAFVIALTIFAVFKFIEMLLEVPETRMNRFLDTVASLVGFEMAYFFAPGFSYTELHILFGVVAIETLVLVLIGLKASRQAVEQEAMLIEEVKTRRSWLNRQRRAIGLRLFDARDRIRERRRKQDEADSLS